MADIILTSDITVRLIQHVGGDHMIVAAAKVSTDGNDCIQYSAKSAEESNYGLIRYLMQHRHGSPFEHGLLTFFVHAPIFVWREWHRHRIGHCLAGDTLVPAGKNSGKRTIAEIYRNWHIGVPDRNPFTAEVGASYCKQTGMWRAVGKRYETKEEAIEAKRQHEQDNPAWRYRLLPSCKNLLTRVLNRETMKFEQARMANVFETGVKEVLLMETANGKTLRCSKDHRILTENGWIRAGDLRRGDYIATLGKQSIHKERRIPPALRSGIGVWTSMQRKRLIRLVDFCYICGGRFRRRHLMLDHVVPVVADLLKALDVTNLKPACEECHRIKSNGEQKLARRGCIAGVRFARVRRTPLVDGEEMCYDISMSGQWCNFLANDVVVHNSFNEESARYKTLDPVFYLPDPDRPMMKVDGWKPGRPKFKTLDQHYGVDAAPQIAQRKIVAEGVYRELCNNLEESYRLAYESYLTNLDLNVDPGLARDCLPVGIYSSCWVTVNPRSLLHFLSLRMHEPNAKAISYPLWEIEQAARKCEAIFAEHWPLTHRAFVENGRVAP